MHSDDPDRGLAHDLQTLAASMIERRRALLWLAGTGAATLLGCGGGGDAGATTTSSSSDSSSSSSSSSGSSSSTTTTSCSVIPEETAGPYPGDGSNTSNGSTSNVLTLSGIVRSDIRTSVAGASGTAEGVLLTVTITLVNTNSSCADLSGYAIYLWHCNRDGKYSLYSTGITDQNYLRGVQVTDSNGQVTFTTIFPACYSGRWPHIHFEIYPSLASATSYANKVKTSQMAMPSDACTTVFNTATGYSASVSNFAQVSLATDNIFSDGYSTQMPTVSGDISNGYTATLTVGIAA
jgi:protocatechuate 3,4-dioxygenase beta subunit